MSEEAEREETRDWIRQLQEEEQEEGKNNCKRQLNNNLNTIFSIRYEALLSSIYHNFTTRLGQLLKDLSSAVRISLVVHLKFQVECSG